MTKLGTLVIMSGKDMDMALTQMEHPVKNGIGGFSKTDTSFVVYFDAAPPAVASELSREIFDVTGVRPGATHFGNSQDMYPIPNRILPDLKKKFNVAQVTGFDEMKVKIESLKKAARTKYLAKLGIQETGGREF